MEKLKRKIREIPNFPKPGILFYDITTLLKDNEGFRTIMDILTTRYENRGIRKVLGIESRGFIFAPALAYAISAGFVPVRKPGKLPADTFQISYDLEYGQDSLEIHTDGIEPGEPVLIVDDLIATGGTAAATAKMVQQLGAEIKGLAFVVELEFLEGRKRLDGFDLFSIVKY